MWWPKIRTFYRNICSHFSPLLLFFLLHGFGCVAFLRLNVRCCLFAQICYCFWTVNYPSAPCACNSWSVYSQVPFFPPVCISGDCCLSHRVFLSPSVLCRLCSLLQLCTCLRCVTSCLSLLLPPVRCLYVWGFFFLSLVVCTDFNDKPVTTSMYSILCWCNV